MKKILFAAMACCLAACSKPLRIEVVNTGAADLANESIEVAWSELDGTKITPANVVVRHNGREIPSQVLMLDDQPATLLFQSDVAAGAAETFTVEAGVRSEYPAKAYGRFVPERLDDYAWENDKVAFRAYGPALESAPGEMLATPGFDAWVKCVDTLVIDARYLRGNYHHNYGDGMDCYKVGRTLGAGASAPYAADTLWLSRNFETFKTVANGPIRTIVRLTYAPFDVDGTAVSLTKYISLDAHSHFNRILNIYEGDFDTLPVAAGVVRHDVKGVREGSGWIAMYEAASDSADPEADGDMYFAVIQDDAQFVESLCGHMVALRGVKSGQCVEYLAGSGWSGAGISSLDEWCAIVEAEAASYANPLTVKIIK